jgi:hypothetical protein
MAGRCAKVGGRGNYSMSAKTPKNWKKHVRVHEYENKLQKNGTVNVNA